MIEQRFERRGKAQGAFHISIESRAFSLYGIRMQFLMFVSLSFVASFALISYSLWAVDIVSRFSFEFCCLRFLFGATAMH